MARKKEKTARPFPVTGGQWALFALVDLIVTFQFTARFLFMEERQTAVTARQLGIFAVCAVGVAAVLLGLARLLRAWDERGVFLAKPARKRARSRTGWIAAGLVFLAVTAAGRCWLPDFVGVSYRETRITLTAAGDGRVGLLSTCYVEGAAAATEVSDAAGDWAVGPDGNWWASEGGSVLTVDIPAAADVDLRLIPGGDGGTVEIRDGARLVRRDLYASDPSDVPSVYHVRSGIVSAAPGALLWLLAALIGAAYAAAARELWAATAGEASHRRYGRAVFFALTGIWLFYLAAGNPGAMSTDSLSQLSQAMGVNPVTDSHPALLTFFYRLVLRLTGSAACITLCQILAYAAVVSAFAAYLSRRGLSRRWLTFFALLFGVHIVNGIYAAVLWKDVPYTVVLLWLTLLLLRIGDERKAFFTPGNILQTGVCLALTLLLRHNGVIVLLAVLLTLAVQSLLWHTARPVLAGALGLALVLGIRGPGFRAAGVETQAIYDPAEFLHGMAYVQLVTGEEDPFLTDLAPAEAWEEIYYPYSANSVTMSPRSLQYDIPERASALGRDAVVGAYLRAFARHPFLILKDRLFGCNLLWNPVPSGYNYRVCGDRYEYVVEYNQLGFFCRENFLTEAVDAAYGFTSDYSAVDAAVWRPGWCVAAALLLTWLALAERKRGAALAALPMAANCVSLAMAMAWQDYRYVYFAFVCAMMLFISHFAPPIKREETASL